MVHLKRCGSGAEWAGFGRRRSGGRRGVLISLKLVSFCHADSSQMADPHMDTCNGGPHSRCDVVGGTILGDAVVDWCALNIRLCVRMSVPV